MDMTKADFMGMIMPQKHLAGQNPDDFFSQNGAWRNYLPMKAQNNASSSPLDLLPMKMRPMAEKTGVGIYNQPQAPQQAPQRQYGLLNNFTPYQPNFGSGMPLDQLLGLVRGNANQSISQNLPQIR